ncbi:hypothetical protein F1559_001106 [Cyanidiococcus yangmingshanensis]|uniref:Uncharacterized protein n=1 Tax=Cyanidiococcus yangmingshanensis TaxID=2690220 RepID=A0A7J7ICL9_9RHOD|nr:hypothetical protein F1559_001106 [Cyanidiococcus yangmingshanensis]
MVQTFRNKKKLQRKVGTKAIQRTRRYVQREVALCLVSLVVLLLWCRVPEVLAVDSSRTDDDAGILRIGSSRVASSAMPSSAATLLPPTGSPSNGPFPASWNCSTASFLLQESCSAVANAVSANPNNPFAAVIAVGGVSEFCPCATALSCVQSRCGSTNSSSTSFLVVNGVNMTQVVALTNILCDSNTTSCG